MIPLQHQAQISDRVVAWVFIYMVNHFVRRKVAPNALLHDETVVHHIPLAISKRMLWRHLSSIPTALPVADEAAPTARRHAALSVRAARKRTKLSSAVSARCKVAPARRAGVLGRFSPPRRKIAFPGTVLRGSLAPVFRAERTGALGAGQEESSMFHLVMITLEEKYCEIAAKRLAQGAFSF